MTYRQSLSCYAAFDSGVAPDANRRFVATRPTLLKCVWFARLSADPPTSNP